MIFQVTSQYAALWTHPDLLDLAERELDCQLWIIFPLNGEVTVSMWLSVSFEILDFFIQEVINYLLNR